LFEVDKKYGKFLKNLLKVYGGLKRKIYSELLETMEKGNEEFKKLMDKMMEEMLVNLI